MGMINKSKFVFCFTTYLLSFLYAPYTNSDDDLFKQYSYIYRFPILEEVTPEYFMTQRKVLKHVRKNQRHISDENMRFSSTYLEDSPTRDLYTATAALFYKYILTTNKNEICNIVKKLEDLDEKYFEENEKSYPNIRLVLDKIYNGAWRQIASIEGNRIALFESAIYWLDDTDPRSYRSSNLINGIHPKYSDYQGFEYLEASKKQGFVAAKNLFNKLAKNEKFKTIAFRPVICPVRNY